MSVKEVSKKILPQYFEAVKRGVKTFEIRKDKDEIQVGDILILKEWEWETGKYTGRELKKEVAYVLRNIPQYGVQEGYFIISLKDFDNGWIPTSERLPEKDGNYLITSNGRVYEAYYQDGFWLDPIEFYRVYRSVTAWQPLPAPYNPKGE